MNKDKEKKNIIVFICKDCGEVFQQVYDGRCWTCMNKYEDGKLSTVANNSEV